MLLYYKTEEMVSIMREYIVNYLLNNEKEMILKSISKDLDCKKHIESYQLVFLINQKLTQKVESLNLINDKTPKENVVTGN